jgi:V/A-type H+-transporting ATPase subunit A
MERQFMLLGMILDFDKLSRAAIAQGAELSKLNSIPAKEKIGRAKSVPADKYVAEYTAIGKEMAEQIEEIVQRGEEQ